MIYNALDNNSKNKNNKNTNYLSELAELGGSNGCIFAAIVCARRRSAHTSGVLIGRRDETGRQSMKRTAQIRNTSRRDRKRDVVSAAVFRAGKKRHEGKGHNNGRFRIGKILKEKKRVNVAVLAIGVLCCGP